jgi:hypothetical protein
MVDCDCIGDESENDESVKISPLSTTNMAIGENSVMLIATTTSNK